MNEETKRKAAIISEGTLTFTDEFTEITGDANIKEMIFEGSVKIFGNVHADKIKVSGQIEVTGELEAYELDAGGEITVRKSAKVSDICGASIYVKENLKSDVEIEANILMVGGNLDAFVVSLGDDKDEKIGDVLLVDGETNIKEALYINEKQVMF